MPTRSEAMRARWQDPEQAARMRANLERGRAPRVKLPDPPGPPADPSAAPPPAADPERKPPAGDPPRRSLFASILTGTARDLIDLAGRRRR